MCHLTTPNCHTPLLSDLLKLSTGHILKTCLININEGSSNLFIVTPTYFLKRHNQPNDVPALKASVYTALTVRVSRVVSYTMRVSKCCS